MKINPDDCAPVEIYKLLIGSITPRPIAFVSSIGANGVYNLAPFSFFTGISANPPVIGFSPMVNRQQNVRDSRVNIEATHDFVVNIVSESLVEKMNETAVDVPPDVDEFELAGLTPVASEVVSAPRVGEARISMECRLVQVVDISREVLGGAFVIGRVVHFHVDDELFDDFRIDADALATVGRMGGNAYVRTRDRFDLPRPTLKGEAPIER